MARKKWTAQTEVTDSLLKIREKRKWQLAYRRYVLQESTSESYAFYFGLDAKTLRQWFELQFSDELNWNNYGKAWQFDHIIPSSYFNYANEEDLRLCWSFINMRVERLDSTKVGADNIDLLAAKTYFQDIFSNTGFTLCGKMIDKLSSIESSSIEGKEAREAFIIQNKILLEGVTTLNRDEFLRLAEGLTLDEILLEREILRKFS